MPGCAAYAAVQTAQDYHLWDCPVLIFLPASMLFIAITNGYQCRTCKKRWKLYCIYAKFGKSEHDVETQCIASLQKLFLSQQIVGHFFKFGYKFSIIFTRSGPGETGMYFTHVAFFINDDRCGK